MATTTRLANSAVVWRYLIACVFLFWSLLCSAKSTIWIALSETSAAHNEVAQTIRANVDKSTQTPIEWVVEPWSALESRLPERGAAPKLVIAIGARAWAGAAQRFATKDGSAPQGDLAPALFATLLPRSAFEQSLARIPPGPRQGAVSAVFLDQPLSRQARLLRLAFPTARNIGLLLGPESRLNVAEIRSALGHEAFVAGYEDCVDCPIASQLQNVLERAEVLLAVPDQQIFNGNTIAGILSAGYRRRVPLVGFSPAYVKAGAVLGLYTTPEQQGSNSAEFVVRFLQTGHLPPARASSLFTVGVNPDVARAFGLTLDEKQLEGQLRKDAR